MLICFEGIDGSGKTTQVALAESWLKKKGYEVVVTEWNSSALFHGAIKKAKKQQAFCAATYSLAHALDFAERYFHTVLPAIKCGAIVLCDRYVPTALARDSVRGCPIGWIDNVYGFAVSPDLKLYFDTNVNVALARILKCKEVPSFYEAGMDVIKDTDPCHAFLEYQECLKSVYAELFQPREFVDANKSVETVQKVIETKISRLLTRAEQKNKELSICRRNVKI